MTALQNSVDDSVDRPRRDSDYGLPRQRRAVDAQHLALLIDQCAARLPHIELHVGADETIDLSAAPGAPPLAGARDNTAGCRDVSQPRTANRQHNLACPQIRVGDALYRGKVR